MCQLVALGMASLIMIVLFVEKRCAVSLALSP